MNGAEILKFSIWMQFDGTLGAMQL